MKNDFQDSLIKRLNRDAAYRALHRRDKCVLKSTRSFRDTHSSPTCRCGECLLAISILRGQRLTEGRKDLSLKKLKKDSITPLAMKAMALASLGNSITILFYSVMLSLPFTLTHAVSIGTKVSQETPWGVEITKEQIVNAARTPFEVEPPMPAAPSNVEPSTSAAPSNVEPSRPAAPTLF